MNRDDRMEPEEEEFDEPEDSRKGDLNQNNGKKHNDEKETHHDEWPYLVAYIC